MTESHCKPVHHPKKLWQKITNIIANISFFCAAIGGVITLIYIDEVSEVYKASLGAITFISFAFGIVLKAMSTTSIPSFKPDQ